jgi:ubiquinone/menaquinone biosynthesis C-methylase UbiE/uncharacterized protein YbaR (Trm112 family)
MKKNLLALIKCPICDFKKFKLKVIKKTKLEIRSGQIICLRCQQVFKIEKGILNLLFQPSQTIVKEKQAIQSVVIKKERPPEICNDQWLLSLPYPQTMGTNPKILRSITQSGHNFEEFMGKIKINQTSKILDIGAGCCWTTRMITKKGADAVALDISPAKYAGLGAADVYFKKDRIYFERILGDMNNLPFREKSFDFVISCASLHHSSSLKKTYQEIYRVLKGNGSLLITNEPATGFLRNKKEEKRELVVDRKVGFNEHVYSIQEWIKTAEKIGFSSQLLIARNSLESLIKKETKNKMFSLIKKIWLKVPPKIQFSLIGPFYYYFIAIFGLPFNLILYKKTKRG